MVRTVKDPDVRRNEIIDVAQALFLSKGYDNTSVQDVLDGAGIAKGTFYHYFGSKMELLDALVDRLTDVASGFCGTDRARPELSAVEKLHAYLRHHHAVEDGEPALPHGHGARHLPR